jgi:hypothetical protein
VEDLLLSRVFCLGGVLYVALVKPNEECLYWSKKYTAKMLSRLLHIAFSFQSELGWHIEM